MSEGDWSSEGTRVGPPKRKVPLWVWGCGGGCALFLLVGVVLAVFGMRTVKKMFDPEANWASIDAVLPVVERPEGYMVMRFPLKFDGVQIWMLTAGDQSHQVMLFHGSGGESTEDTRVELFGPAAASREDAEVGTLVVQGLELRCLRHRTVPNRGSGKDFSDSVMEMFDGSNLVVELAPPERGELLALMYTKPRSRERVEDDELIEFLSHFRLADALGASEDTPVSELEPPADEPAEEEPVDEPQDPEQD